VRAWTVRRLTHEALAIARKMALCGTTTVEAKSGYGLELNAELKQLRVSRSLDGHPVSVINTCLAAHMPPPEFDERPDDYIAYCVQEILPEVARRRLAAFADIYCDDCAFTPAQAQRYLSAAKVLGLGVRIHASQFANMGAVQLGIQMDAASVDHLEAAGPAEVEALSRANTVATLLPGSVLHLGLQRHAPARALIDGGVPVAIATDFNPGTSPVWNMQAVISLACSQLKMSPAEAIVASTINGAHALGVADQCGSLEAGKQADILVLECGDYRELPYYYGGNQVRMTIRKGVILQEKELADATQAG
jgi:imidazolonepropionase